MTKNTLISFCLSLATVAYITIVSWLLQHGESLFGAVKNFWAPVMFLSLFVFSALLTSTLILGYPLWLYLSDRRSDALKMFFSILTWFFLMVLGVFVLGTFFFKM